MEEKFTMTIYRKQLPPLILAFGSLSDVSGSGNPVSLLNHVTDYVGNGKSVIDPRSAIFNKMLGIFVIAADRSVLAHPSFMPFLLIAWLACIPQKWLIGVYRFGVGVHDGKWHPELASIPHCTKFKNRRKG